MLKYSCDIYSDEILGCIDRGEDVALTKCTIKAGKESDLTLAKPTVNTAIRTVGCSFEIQVSFPGVTFTKDAIFVDVEFKEDISFERTKFAKLADFSESTFPEANFSNAEFSGIADFSECKFDRAAFTGASFRGLEYVQGIS